ncbi:hypothetical protein LguiA_016641 [Lonicera macranthoides]
METNCGRRRKPVLQIDREIKHVQICGERRKLRGCEIEWVWYYNQLWTGFFDICFSFQEPIQ